MGTTLSGVGQCEMHRTKVIIYVAKLRRTTFDEAIVTYQNQHKQSQGNLNTTSPKLSTIPYPSLSNK